MANPPIRMVSAVFSDLVDSVGLAERLSEHAYFNEVLQPFYAIAKEVVTDHGGTMRPYVAGDKVMAVFGVPVEQADDAERFIRRCREAAADSQLDTQIKWRALQGVVLARRGEFEEATRLAREAVDLAERSEQVDSQAEALADLADVLHRTGAVQEAARPAERALALYDRKGNLVAAARVRRSLDQLVGRPGPQPGTGLSAG